MFIVDSHWYVAHTRSNHEQKVITELSARNVETYLPVFSELREWNDRKKLIELPLLPGYVFVRMIDSPLSRLEVLKIKGVVRILGQGDRIEPVPEEELEALQRLLKTSGRCLTHPLLRVGAWVRVRYGPLKGLEGLLVGMKNQTRLVISITLLSQSVSAEIDANDVELLRSPGATAVKSRRSNQPHVVAGNGAAFSNALS